MKIEDLTQEQLDDFERFTERALDIIQGERGECPVRLLEFAMQKGGAGWMECRDCDRTTIDNETARDCWFTYLVTRG